MKTFKEIAVILLLLILITGGCKKEIAVFSVKGTVYENCNNVPAKDYDFVLRAASYSLIGWNNDVFGMGTTDANGNFKISYPDDRNHDNNQKTLWGEAGLQIEGIIADNLEVEIVLNAETKTRIFVTTSNPLTSNDTLFYLLENHNLNYSYIVGPFSNGLIDSITTSKVLIKTSDESVNDYNNFLQTDHLIWGIGFSNFQQVWHDSAYENYHHIPVEPACNNINDLTINLQE